MALGPNEATPRSPAGDHNPWFIAFVLSIAPFMEVLDTTIANVALTHIAGSLAASTDESTWILTAYLVSNAIILPISGWLSNVLGRKRIFLICIALFSATSLLCGIAPTLGFMLVARVLQGLGGGGLAPVAQSMLTDSFPREKRSQVFALYGLTIIAAPALGPVIGGWLTDNISWHWVFLINLPVGLIAFVLVSIFVTEPPLLIKERKELIAKGLSVDYVGFAMVVIGFGFLQVVLDQFQEDDGFNSHAVVAMTIISCVALAILFVWEWEHPQPVMDIRLLRFPSFAISNVVLFVVGFVMLASTQLVPQLTQSLFEYTATTSGFSLGLGGVATIMALPIAGFLTGKYFQPKWLMIVGFVVMGIGLIVQSRIDLDASFSVIVIDRMLQMIAMPFIFIPNSAVSFNGIPANKTSEASALISLTRNLGSSFGISFVQTLLAWRTQFHYERLGESGTPYRTGLTHGATAFLSAVQTQASLLSYLDLFYVLGIFSFLVCPLILFIKSTPKRQPQ